MPSERSIGFLEDVLHHIDLAVEFVGDLDVRAFESDLLRVYAVIRCLEVISDASRRLPDEFKARHPHIALREIAGAGNVYRHDYQDVAAARIWQTLRIALPPLRDAVERELHPSAD